MASLKQLIVELDTFEIKAIGETDHLILHYFVELPPSKNSLSSTE